MQKQNVTLSLPKTLLKSAKALAVSKDTSLSEFFKIVLEEKVREATGYASARDRQVRMIGQGFDFGTNGRISCSRESLHDR